MTSWRKSDDDEKIETADVGLADVKMRTKDFADPFRSANAWIPKGTPVYTNRVTYWQPVPWDNLGGMMSLAGDATHPMTFRKLHAGLRSNMHYEAHGLLQTGVKVSTMRLQTWQIMSLPFEP